MTSTFPRKLTLLAASFLLAAAAFWAVILTDPPKTEAAGNAIPVMEMMKRAPLSLPGGTGETI